ncbi:protein-lysine methyltransferase METTL21C isoform X2 [Kryptolebias marmoratus]|nr:protein-lysine methyltransferase METTL21C isoform X2 [Kryptolebias marmoratus]
MIWPAALDLCHYLDTHRDRWNLVDKAVLEVGAGTGLVSIVAALLGGWVTATDLPEVLDNMRVNLSRNTRGRCRHTPQVAALTWGHDLEHTFPSSACRYDYVLAADVVYHHDFLDELLATMKHFCRPGTTLIWANKVRFESDLVFTENFHKSFQTSVLSEDGEVKIFMATSREGEDEELGVSDLEEKLNGDELPDVPREKESDELEAEGGGEESSERESGEEEESEKSSEPGEGGAKEDEAEEQTDKSSRDENVSEQKFVKQSWTPSVLCSTTKEVFSYVGENIVIYESLDSYGATLWPAALALSSFLETNSQTFGLQGKEVLELGSGTGLVAIVASLLGASVMATDLPEVLSNLQANVMRNTRGRCRHTPRIAALSWSHNLEHTFRSSACRYDYVLAADVVYQHDFLDELLATMKHFCRPGTTLIWANKVRLESDLVFTENFHKSFQTSVLSEDGEVKIFMATSREGD